jgi:hypothetical protein
MTLEGRTGELTETQIGVKVFDRSEGYNSSEDNIVRSHARLLRAKLQTYFEGAGESEELVLTIPKGGYVPIFEKRSIDPVLSPPPAANLEIMPAPKPPGASRKWIATAILAVILCAGALWVAKAWKSPSASAAHGRLSHLLWSRIFQPNRNTILVPADSGLVMYENLSQRTVHLPEYLGRQYLSASLPHGPDAIAKTINGLGSRRYTSVVDLNLMAGLVRLPEVVPGRLRIRYARDLSMGDFKESNVVLSGAAEANPWAELFENRLDFTIIDDQVQSVFEITNRSPKPGEQGRYSYDPLNPNQRAFSLLAFFSDRSGSANALLIQGTTVAGTEAAADFVLDDNAMTPLLRRAQMPDGSLDDFQVLLETRNVAGSAPRAQILASHFGRSNP